MPQLNCLSVGSRGPIKRVCHPYCITVIIIRKPSEPEPPSISNLLYFSGVLLLYFRSGPDPACYEYSTVQYRTARKDR